ncbi:MAG: phosphatidate cytidylyltransferase [Acidobacteria bacterium]|nr:phosphatidate cytidylyltransferase [Acidobacteriota bacterium]
MTRVASALVLGAVVGLTLWVLPPWATAVLACAAAVVAGLEIAGLSARAEAAVPAAFLSTGAAALLLAVAATSRHAPAADAPVAVLLALVVGGGAVALTLGPPSHATLTRAAVLVMAPVYVGAPLGALVWVQWAMGPAATTWLVATLAASDITQYYVGRRFGRTRLAPAVSPAKTNEGAIGGVSAATIAGVVLGPLCVGTSPLMGGLVALVVAMFGIAGDLFESLLKRSAGAKDASALIPGHGGVLDRLDSYLFAAPVFFLFLRYVI